MILFAVYSRAQMKICEAAARKIMSRGTAVKIISFNDGDDVNAALAAAAAKAGIPFGDLASAVARTPAEASSPAGAADRQPWKPTDVELSYRALLARQIAAAGSILDEANATVLVVCEDGPGGCGPLINAARSRGIPVFDMPFGIGESRDYDNFLRDKAREGNLNIVPDSAVGDVLRRVASHWIRIIDQGDVTLFPAEFILARIAVGMDIPLPWVVHGGRADRLLVESEAMRAIYDREGVPSAKMIMTGSIYADVVADVVESDENVRKAVAERRRLDRKRLKVLIAPPPSYHASHGHVAEFSTYRETVDRLVQAARSGGAADVTVSLHPATRPEDREAWAEQPVTLSDEWLLELQPKHDVLLTSFSSTIRWAIVCGKPVLNYDMYRMDLSTYDGMPGVLTLSTIDGVGRVIGGLAADHEAYDRLARAQRARSSRWGELDGKSFNRIWGAIEAGLTDQTGAAQPPANDQKNVVGPYHRPETHAEIATPEPKHMSGWLDRTIARFARVATSLPGGDRSGGKR